MTNANVIYEIGYATSNGIPVVLLSQEPEASPFDLKDLSQIEYKPDELDAARGKLARQLHQRTRHRGRRYVSIVRGALRERLAIQGI